MPPWHTCQVTGSNTLGCICWLRVRHPDSALVNDEEAVARLRTASGGYRANTHLTTWPYSPRRHVRCELDEYVLQQQSAAGTFDAPCKPHEIRAHEGIAVRSPTRRFGWLIEPCKVMLARSLRCRVGNREIAEAASQLETLAQMERWLPQARQQTMRSGRASSGCKCAQCSPKGLKSYLKGCSPQRRVASSGLWNQTEGTSCRLIEEPPSPGQVLKRRGHSLSRCSATMGSGLWDRCPVLFRTLWKHSERLTPDMRLPLWRGAITRPRRMAAST